MDLKEHIVQHEILDVNDQAFIDGNFLKLDQHPQQIILGKIKSTGDEITYTSPVPTGLVATVTLNGGYLDGYYDYAVYAYKDVDGVRIYSPANSFNRTVVANSSISASWNDMGVTGYAVQVSGAGDYWYVDLFDNLGFTDDGNYTYWNYGILDPSPTSYFQVLDLLDLRNNLSLHNFLVKGNGRVGLDTLTPIRKFHQFGGKFLVESDYGSYGQFQLVNPIAGETTIVFGSDCVVDDNDFSLTPNSSAANIWAFGLGSYGGYPSSFNIGNNLTGVLLSLDGNTGFIGMGTITPSEVLQVNGTVLATGIKDSGLTSGRVPYAGTDGLLQDSANLVFDGTKLGIGGTVPTHTLTLPSTSTGIALYNTADQTTNYERVRMYVSGNVFNITEEVGGTGIQRGMFVGLFSSIGTTFMPTTAPKIKHDFGSTDLTTGALISNIGTFTAAANTQTFFGIAPTITQSSTAGYTALLINPTETTTGSGAKNLIDAQVGSVSKFKVSNTGVVTAPTYNLSDGSDKNYTLSVYGAGTAAVVTNTSKLLDFGTTDPSLTINKAGTYSLRARVRLDRDNGSHIITHTVTFKIRRTNNTATDITGALTAYVDEAHAASTKTEQILTLPEVIYTTANTNDIIELWSVIDSSTTSGTHAVVEANIIAQRLY